MCNDSLRNKLSKGEEVKGCIMLSGKVTYCLVVDVLDGVCGASVVHRCWQCIRILVLSTTLLWSMRHAGILLHPPV